MEREVCMDSKRETEMMEDHITGELTCTECGLVNSVNNINDTQDVQIFEENKDAQRIEHAWQEGDEDNDYGLLSETLIVGGRRDSKELMRVQKLVRNLPREDPLLFSGSSSSREREPSSNDTGTTAMKHGKVLKERKVEMENMAMCVLLPGEEDHAKHIVSEAYELYKSFFNSAVANDNNTSPSAVSISTHLRWTSAHVKALLAACLMEGAKRIGMGKPVTDWSKPFGLHVWQIYQATKHIEPFLRNPKGIGATVCANPYASTDAIGHGNGDPVQISAEEVAERGAEAIRVHLNKVCCALGFHKKDKALCCEMAERLMKKTSSCRKPSTLAGLIAGIYGLVKGVHVNKKVLFKNSSSQKALRNAFKDTQSELAFIVPACFGHPDAWLHKIESP